MEVFAKHNQAHRPKPSLTKPGQSRSSYPSPDERVLPIAVDKYGRERIGFVKRRDFADYLLLHKDPQFIQRLPDFHLPMLGVGSFRAFEVADDAMYPLEPGAIIVGEYVRDWENLATGKTFVILHQDLGILYRRVFNSPRYNHLKLVSEKKDYPAHTVGMGKLYEIWQARMFIGT